LRNLERKLKEGNFMKIDERMKKYEYVTRNHLTIRTPVVVRIDGKAFHTFTKGLISPYDELLAETMEETLLYLCENIQNCVLGYRQSDEISLLLVDYKTFESQPWFDNNISKIVSVTASMATAKFNESFKRLAKETILKLLNDVYLKELSDKEREKYISVLENKIKTLALFDSRAFNLPREEVANYFLWRQNDAVKNSIASTGQKYFSAKQLNGKNGMQIKEMLLEKGINWEDYPTVFKRGICARKDENGKWSADREIPIFKDKWEYITEHINPDEE
jgi:conserved hypothetical protein